jgi:hypothetical protein
VSLGGNVGHPDRDQLQVPEGSDLSIGALRPESGTVWLGFFLVGFGVLVGPLNLFVFAPAKKRHRLFFTTPLISLGAVAVLVLAIFVQDGLGGDGWRRAVVIFVPGDNQAAVIQEQSARTGFLTRRSFALADDAALAVLPIDFATNPNRLYTMLDLGRANDRASGGWFRSRERQAHVLQRLVPTRGRVERVGVSSDGAPIIESSIGTALHDFVWVDQTGTVWNAPEVPAGRRVTLTRGGTWIASRPLGGTDRFGGLLRAAAPQQPGHWGARSGAGELAPIETLSAIRWRESEVIMTGMLEDVTQPKEGVR